MRVRVHRWNNKDIVELWAQGVDGAPAQQLEKIVTDFWEVLSSHNLTNTDVVFSRLWMKNGDHVEQIAETRKRLLRGPERSATSSFFSKAMFSGRGDVALEMLAFRAAQPNSRRLVDFTPPRPYAHYLVQDEWLFLSGMAEEASTIDEQFERALSKVQEALNRENMEWGDVREARLFLERGQGNLEWLRRKFSDAVPVPTPWLSLELVDGLASENKHLEIEIIANK